MSHDFPNNSNLSNLLRLGSGGFSSVYLVEVVLFIHVLSRFCIMNKNFWESTQRLVEV